MNNADTKDVQDMYVETFEEGVRKAADKAAKAATLESIYNILVSITEVAAAANGGRMLLLSQLKAIGVTAAMFDRLAVQRPDLHEWLSQK